MLKVFKVLKASVTVNEQLVSSINSGLCLLVGLSVDDSDEDIQWMANKLVKLRLFDGGACVADNRLEILSVSQFTLHASLKGNSLDYRKAMKSSDARDAYQHFLNTLSQLHHPDLIKDGRFGEMMRVNIENDGPFTINLDSKIRK
ncbi:D-tyrosyl-tRNA(Tyr) deacylase 1 [Wallemia ichthyophaga EXF-994]|uniref:D-aminoacyl-tRNA deacylase n=1 Tax=Wallemia ichthyophaga (strain EXF-994 / CBS 113033) TaxID=1299270 RepID=R9AC46_WALI9|nr:D-tyrosyl-tRNA(Tyr) deacylase 1 [Wallemia ichthyophaga EXF-994]EOQ99717.1 D-tyrosyl-tRNA(Tyr) deacylase 1 [Wallemia ichthyophaga EXF-994]TIB33350.1 hypothetical protein E3P84_02235 [Wallemia ichthyophaga]TIB41228.1 hypothetical protein E3P83_02188 [Wallemia ichthyophaga]